MDSSLTGNFTCITLSELSQNVSMQPYECPQNKKADTNYFQFLNATFYNRISGTNDPLGTVYKPVLYGPSDDFEIWSRAFSDMNAALETLHLWETELGNTPLNPSLYRIFPPRYVQFNIGIEDMETTVMLPVFFPTMIYGPNAVPGQAERFIFASTFPYRDTDFGDFLAWFQVMGIYYLMDIYPSEEKLFKVLRDPSSKINLPETTIDMLLYPKRPYDFARCVCVLPSFNAKKMFFEHRSKRVISTRNIVAEKLKKRLSRTAKSKLKKP